MLATMYVHMKKVQGSMKRLYQLVCPISWWEFILRVIVAAVWLTV